MANNVQPTMSITMCMREKERLQHMEIMTYMCVVHKEI